MKNIENHRSLTLPGSVPSQKRYLGEMPGVPLQDLWLDIPTCDLCCVIASEAKQSRRLTSVSCQWSEIASSQTPRNDMLLIRRKLSFKYEKDLSLQR